MKKDYSIRPMTEADYDDVFALWETITGFGIRSIDDSREGVARFLNRNPGLSVVAVSDGRIVGSILCGHDGRRGCLYHVCVEESCRQMGIGQSMVETCVKALAQEGINKVNLIAFRRNAVGNMFWGKLEWIYRDDLNYYDLALNKDNYTVFIN
ncbi:MAG: GNAT family N-acetyltransferase [Lachnospiraceae bacterium]|nr:GNAT family N-acetyltransferase [Lachnospiraceae bacterium]